MDDFVLTNENWRRGEDAANTWLIPPGVSAQTVYRFVKTRVNTSVTLCLSVMAQGQVAGTGYFNSVKVCLSSSKY